MPGPDELLAELEAMPEPRPRRRTVVLPETRVTPTTATMAEGEGEVREGPEFDPEAPQKRLGAPSPPLGLAGQTAGRRMEEAAARRARPQELERRALRDAEHAPVWDLLASGLPSATPGAPARRTAARVSEVWEDIARDPRAAAGAAASGAMQGVSRGTADESIAGAIGMLPESVTGVRESPQETEALMRRAFREGRQGSPYLADVSRDASMLATSPGTIPGGAMGRIGMSAAEGAVAGAGFSDAQSPSEAVVPALLGGGLGAVGGAGAEALSAATSTGPQAGQIGQALSRRAEAAQRGADQARLEASGVWGGRAMQAADDLPGGRGALAEDLRRLDVGERPPGRLGFEGDAPRGMTIPRMDRAAGDAEAIRRASGRSMEVLAQQIDDAGERVSTLGAASQVGRLADDLERLPVGGRQSAQQLRELAGDLQSGGDMSMRDAWAQRQLLDDMIGAYARDPNLSRLSGRLQTVRDALSAEMEAAAARSGQGGAWRQASRDYQVGAFMRDQGQGASRLSVGGGMGGATAAGQIAAEMVTTGSPGAVAMAAPRMIAAREAAQAGRMIQPGVRAVLGERSADWQRRGAEMMLRAAQRDPGRFGRFARVLQEAASRGAPALTTTHYTLAAQDAEYRRLLAELASADPVEDLPPAQRAIAESGEE